MRSMRMMAVAGAVLACLCGSVGAQTNSDDGLLVLMAKKQGQEQALLDGYGKALGFIMTDLTQRGDLDSYVVVETEKKRLDEEKSIPALSEAKDAFKSAAAASFKARVELLRRCVAALDSLVKAEMKVGRIDGAKEAKAEKDKVVLELAGLEAKMPKEEKEKKVVKYPDISGTWLDSNVGSVWIFAQKPGGKLTLKGYSADNTVTYEGTGTVSVAGEVSHSIKWLKNPGKYKNGSRSFKLSEDGTSMESTSHAGIKYVKKEVK